ncbi:MAG: heme o synthase [Candidatus Saccharimonadales bacterium]
MTTKISFKDYYNLTKPGIIYSNLLTAAAGFLFASHWHNSYRLFISMLIGLALIIASACTVNNVIDRKIDAKMDRTKKRALVTGKISVKDALKFATVIGVAGALILGILVNSTALLLALAGVAIYVVFYGLAKRQSVYGTLVGSLSGAVPPIVGYTAFSGSLDLASVILLMVLVCWQLAHFYGIALYRKKEYAAAGLPVWPIVKGDWNAQLQAIASIAIFALLSICLFIFGYVGYVYLLAMLIIGISWLWYSVITANRLSANIWGRKLFISSLIVMLLFCISISFGPLLP